MPDISQELRTAAEIDKSLRAHLITQFGDTIAEDEQCLLDTLDGISDFDVAVDHALAAISDGETLAEAAKMRAKWLEDRASAAEARVKRIRGALLFAMLDAGRQTIRCTEATVSVKKGSKQVEVFDTDELPLDLLRTKPPEPDKSAIKKALLAGTAVPGARLIDGPASIAINRS